MLSETWEHNFNEQSDEIISLAKEIKDEIEKLSLLLVKGRANGVYTSIRFYSDKHPEPVFMEVQGEINSYSYYKNIIQTTPDEKIFSGGMSRDESKLAIAIESFCHDNSISPEDLKILIDRLKKYMR